MPRHTAWLLAALVAVAACASGVATGQTAPPTVPSPTTTLAPPTSAPPDEEWHTLQPVPDPPVLPRRVAVTVQVAEPPPMIPVDPLDGLNGRYACRFATAGRTTPCCPEAVPVLAQFWSGEELAIADFIVGREGGCDEDVVNFLGCAGWFQLCPPIRCHSTCLTGEGNTERAHELFLARGWQPWCFDGRDVTGRC